VATNPDFLLTQQHAEAWEAKNGRIEAGSWVLMRTDWSKRTDAAAFLNIKKYGAHVPGPHPELVPFLAKHRDIMGWGSEGLAPTPGKPSGSIRLFLATASCMAAENWFGKPRESRSATAERIGIDHSSAKDCEGSGSPVAECCTCEFKVSL